MVPTFTYMTCREEGEKITDHDFWQPREPSLGRRVLAPSPFLKLIQSLLDQLLVFQPNGYKDGFHWPRASHVNSGAGVQFGPVEKPVKDLLVFFA